MKPRNIIERIAAAIDRATGETMPPKAQATALSPAETERVFRQSKAGPVSIMLPSVPPPDLPQPRKPEPPSPRVPFETIARHAAEGLPQPSKSEMAVLQALQRKWDKAFQDANKNFTPDAAQNHYRQISKDEWRKAYETNTPPENLTLTSAADITNEFESKRQFAQMSLDAVQHETEQLCAPIRRSFLASAKRHLEVLELGEQAEYAKFGQPWKAGPRIHALRSLVARLKSSEAIPGQSSPKNLLPYLQFD